MSNIQIIVGSMLGGTEYVAEACEETLNELGYQVDIHLSPDINTILSNTFSSENSEKSNNKTANKNIWIICTSTHGAGDYPDNIKQFVADLKDCAQDLSTVNFLTIGIGDSSYDTFCKAAKDLSTLLLSKGCNELTSVKTFDMSEDIDPEEQSQAWIMSNRDLL